jgi:hypothetical protein
VARLSLIEGEAAVYVDPEAGWEAARVNAHLTGENSVWTEPGARAELQFGGSVLRLGEATQLDLLRLDDDNFRAHVTRGALTIRIRDFDRNESFAVSTPEGRFHFRGTGRFRVESDPARAESLLTVFTGTARLEVAGGTLDVDTGRSVRVTGGDNPRFAFEAAYATALDQWALARDQRWEERESLRYVPRQMTGWEDLDDYGVWRNDAEYGPVWFPTRVEVGWAPYRYGRWTWVRPWGWAWVDDAPWGYAPFHYGRWVFVGNRWGWYPGRYTARPVWAPALVGWVGSSGWSVSLSGGFASVLGWYPLSPYDYYQPWYTTNVTYVTYVNRIVLPDRHRRDHQHDRNGRRNDHREHGATVVPRDQFGSRRPVQSIRATVPGPAVASQPVVAGSAVLPPRPVTRQPERPAASAPSAPGATAPSGGRPAPTAKPAFPATTAPATMPATRQPVPAQPAPAESRQPQARPVAPAAQSPAAPRTPATTERPASTPGARPAPAAPAERPSQPAPRPSAPAERASQPSYRPTPAPVERAPQPASRPAPAPVERASPPVSRPAPAPAERTSPPVSRPAPAPAERASPPASRPAPAPAPAAPAERPSRAPEQPPKPGEKPGRSD